MKYTTLSHPNNSLPDPQAAQQPFDVERWALDVGRSMPRRWSSNHSKFNVQCSMFEPPPFPTTIQPYATNQGPSTKKVRIVPMISGNSVQFVPYQLSCQTLVKFYNIIISEYYNINTSLTSKQASLLLSLIIAQHFSDPQTPEF